MADISVVIVSWNARQFLIKCLHSLRQQAAEVGQTIVVDNASTDGSPEAVRETFPEVRLIQNDRNLGFASANNIAMRLTTGRYVCLINSDVEVLPGCLRSMAAYMDQEVSVGLLGPQITGTDGRVQRSSMKLPTFWNQFCRALALDSLFRGSTWAGGFLMKDFAHDRIRDVEVLNGCFWMARREALDEVGLLDERFFIYGEDIDWCRRFHQAAWRVVFFPGTRAIHHGGASSANAPIRFYIEMQRANLQYWEKHHGRAARISLLLVQGLHEGIRLLGYAAIHVLDSLRGSPRRDVGFKMRRSLASIRWLTGLCPVEEVEPR